MLEDLQARLKVLEEEIVRLIKLASQASDNDKQDNYYRLAQDVQREARELRAEINRAISSSSTGSGSSESQTNPPSSNRAHYRNLEDRGDSPQLRYL
jgi:hypothetical protein